MQTDTSNSRPFGPNSRPNREVTLASSRPKKRAGRKKFKETRHPVYRGVRKRNNNKWVCEVREPNKKSRLWLGTYPTAEMAARAHDVAALALRGELACLNFEDSAWRLKVPVSGDAGDIRRAAVEAAEGFRLREEENKVKVVEDVERMEVLVRMAEQPLLSPTHCFSCLDGGFSSDDVASDVEVSLWSHSF